MDKWQQMGLGVGVMIFIAFVARREARRREVREGGSSDAGDADQKALPSAGEMPPDTTAQAVVAAVVATPAKTDRPKVLPPREQLMADVREREETGLCLHCQRTATHGLPYPEPATRRRVDDDITHLWRVRKRDTVRLWQVRLWPSTFTDDLRDWWEGVDRDALFCAEHYGTAFMQATRFVHEHHAAASRFLADQNDDAAEFKMRLLELMREEADRVKHKRTKSLPS